MRRILITGGSGDLGRPLTALAARSHEVASTYFNNAKVGGGVPQRLDLVDRDATLKVVREFEPAAIIHTAMSDRSAPDDLIRAAHNLIEAAQVVNARLIVLSTDMVFDGRQPPYEESDPPTPVSEYGRAKSEMETACLNAHPNCVVVRTSLIYDFTPANRQLGWMMDKLSQSEPISLFTDEIRNPVYAWNLAEALLELVDHDYGGLLHFAGESPMSRYEYGCYLLKTAGYDPTAFVQASEAEKVAPQRPRDLSLRLTLAKSILGTTPLTIQQAYEQAKSKAT